MYPRHLILRSIPSGGSRISEGGSNRHIHTSGGRALSWGGALCPSRNSKRDRRGSALRPSEGSGAKPQSLLDVMPF